MSGPKQPINLVIAKGNKHLTKAEIKERQDREVQPCTDDIVAPGYLTAAQQKRFNKLAGQLLKINIMGETDVDTLARYVSAQELYEKKTRELRALKPPKKTGDPEKDMALMEMYYKVQEDLIKQQDRFFKQAQTAASSLGLTITSRCKLEVPVSEEAPKVNKFSKFGKAAACE